ncbi:MAG: hypothetical protein QOI53_2683, partial [Verrucomicrobiota bacterium]|nr:hypothetical protein [Verrucomicrobiota bacterium]
MNGNCQKRTQMPSEILNSDCFIACRQISLHATKSAVDGSGNANQTRVERTQDRWSFILILLGMLCLGVGFAQADDDAARPVKNLEEADGQIHWPDEMTPKNADAFVHNQIFIKAP